LNRPLVAGFEVPGDTIFARAMQFTISRSMPLFARGVYWFLGPESVYWGHNALIRVSPFMRHGNVPEMPGTPPRGGTIMSQDIVEAALLGRAGWTVDWDVDSAGSYDEMPANILSYGRRDRRWCQGNFQHFWLIFGGGVRFGHRLYFANGILAYTSGPLLLLLMTLGLVQGLRGRVYEYQQGLLWLFVVPFLIMLLTPKLMGVLDTIRKRRLDWAEALSFALEVPFSLLLAPLLFYLHTTFVLGILRGRVALWISPSRNPGETLPLRTAVQMFWLPGILAVGPTVLAWWFVPSFLVYLLAIIVGWMLAIPLAAGSSWLMRISRIWTARVPAEDSALIDAAESQRELSDVQASASRDPVQRVQHPLS
jgi:membrane glycosyltransferase